MINQITTKISTRIIASLSEVGQVAWDGLLALQADANPFLSLAFLHALHESGSASEKSGWQPQYLSLWNDAELIAALPLYVKFHSYGEYVFDWAWADAYERNGLKYYPKLLSAIPFTPVTGGRLLTRDDQTRAALIALLQSLRQETQTSSTHILYPPANQASALQQAGLMLRSGVQFHWLNAGYADFAAFLTTLERKKRKNILAERRKVAEVGVRFRRVHGQDATEEDWIFFNRCYRRTYTAHHSTPYLNLDFFLQIAAGMPHNLLLIIAERDGPPIASSLSLLVYTGQTLYGRYSLLHHADNRREYFEPPKDIWDIFKALLEERRRCEIEPTLSMLPDALLENPSNASAELRKSECEKCTI